MTENEPSKPESTGKVRPVVGGYGPPPESLDDAIYIDFSDLRIYVPEADKEEVS